MHVKLFAAILTTTFLGIYLITVSPAKAQFLDPDTGIITDQFGVFQDIDPGAALDHQLGLPSDQRFMDDWGTIYDGNGLMIDGPDPSRAPFFR